MYLPQVEENGNNPLENAEIKARAYYEAFSMPVFSCDSGLYFDGLEEELQPGTHVRRVNGKELTDEEMREYYASLAREHGGQLVARYRNAIFFIVDDEKCFSSMDEKLNSEPFLIVPKAHERREKGFPLDSLSVDIESGEYYYDIQNKSVDKLAVEEGFKAFFEKVLEEILF